MRVRKNVIDRAKERKQERERARVREGKRMSQCLARLPASAMVMGLFPHQDGFETDLVFLANPA